MTVDWSKAVEIPQIRRLLQLRLTKYIRNKPTPQQRAFLLLPHKEAFYGGAAGGGKLLDVGTLVPTPDGFRKLSELHPGDFVFGRDGEIHTVLAESESVFAASYRLIFDDGAEVIAHDDHKWLTFDAKELAGITRLNDSWRQQRRERRASRISGRRSEQFTASVVARNKANPPSTKNASVGSVRTTSEIVATLRTLSGRANHAIPTTGPLELPHKNLPLDPYVFGVWLGDGTSRDGAVTTADPEITEAIVKAGFPVRRIDQKLNNVAVTVAFDGLRSILKSVGVLGNKHIPHGYLWASSSQKLALLQGLLDTDGSATTRGHVEFTNTKKILTDSVAHLARSLGHKAKVREGVAKLDGRIIGPKWTVKFAAKMQVFRLPRKANRLVLATRRTTKFRYIVAAERVLPMEMKCLRVSSPDHLFLVSEHFIPTHNSDALLMGALQYVDVPGYAALIIRKTLTDASKPGSLLFRAREWLQPHDCRYSSEDHCWYFPSGATLSFGSLYNEGDEFSYQGSEFTYIAVDEATQLKQHQVDYVTSRLRKPSCNVHKKQIDPSCPGCLQYAHLRNVPLRVRMASNPGNIGHLWVKNRFKIQKIEGRFTPRGRPLYAGTDPERPHVPAFLEDNPYLSQEEYGEQLRGLKDPITRQQLLDGDWGISADGRFKRDWIERYTVDGGYIHFRNRSYMASQCWLFAVMDTASSTASPPSRLEASKKDASWTVVGTVLVLPSSEIMLLDVDRFQAESPDIVKAVDRAFKKFKLSFLAMEVTTQSKHLYQILQSSFNMRGLSTGNKDKLARAVDIQNLMEQHRVGLPERAPWLQTFEDELFTWTGDPKETDDQVDMMAYVGIEMSSRSGSSAIPIQLTGTVIAP